MSNDWIAVLQMASIVLSFFAGATSNRENRRAMIVLSVVLLVWSLALIADVVMTRGLLFDRAL